MQWHYEVEDRVFGGQVCLYCPECDDCYLPGGERAQVTVVFRYEDGTVICQYALYYGDAVEIPVDPAVPEDMQEDFVFDCWDKEILPCTDSAVYTAKFKLKYVCGDLDKSEGIDHKDVEYLLWHILYPTTYPLIMEADFNNDGELDHEDVEYLLWYTLFPNSFPIPEVATPVKRYEEEA